MNVLAIAQVAHAINLAYCLSLGDSSQVAWDDAPEWQRQSAILGVEMHLNNPDATPEQSHESWLAQKVADGWVYGEVKDAEAKTHPCCLPYADLPPEQKAKDYLFRGVVHALKGLPELDMSELQDLRRQLVEAQERSSLVVSGAGPLELTGTPVKYIGIKPDFKDRLYGTGLIWIEGQTRVLPPHLAKSFLRHADLFEVGLVSLVEAGAPSSSTGDDTADRLADVEAQRQKDSRKDLDLNSLHQNVDQMDKAALTEFGARYGVKIAKNATEAKVSDARAEIHAKIDQFGAV